jgi:Rrf2 family protein
MKITSRGKYALMVMIDLAEQNSDSYIKLIDIAERQNISEKYLESIIASLSRCGMVKALRGKGGGYKLANKPEDYTVGSIIKATEGENVTTSCMECKPDECSASAACKTHSMWKELEKMIDDYLEGVTIADLISEK